MIILSSIKILLIWWKKSSIRLMMICMQWRMKNLRSSELKLKTCVTNIHCLSLHIRSWWMVCMEHVLINISSSLMHHWLLILQVNAVILQRQCGIILKNGSIMVFGNVRICGKNLNLNLMKANMIGIERLLYLYILILILFIQHSVISSSVWLKNINRSMILHVRKLIGYWIIVRSSKISWIINGVKKFIIHVMVRTYTSSSLKQFHTHKFVLRRKSILRDMHMLKESIMIHQRFQVQVLRLLNQQLQNFAVLYWRNWWIVWCLITMKKIVLNIFCNLMRN